MPTEKPEPKPAHKVHKEEPPAPEEHSSGKATGQRHDLPPKSPPEHTTPPSDKPVEAEASTEKPTEGEVEKKHESSEHAKPERKSALKKAEEGLCGALSRKKTTWTKRDGILRIRGTVVVGTGQILSIGPGVEVRISSHDACPDTASKDGTGIIVLSGGTLEVSGSPKAPVRFLPDSPATGLFWAGLRLENTSRSQLNLRWFEISAARTGATFLSGEGEIAHGVFERCGVGVAVLGGGAPTIRHSVFHRSKIADIVSKRSAPFIWGNLLLQGETDGIRFDGIGLARLEGNCFFSHRGEAIVRGPVKTGGWKSDTLPDLSGNWRRDPILRTSDSAQRLVAARRKALDTAAWWVPRRALPEPVGEGSWALSAHSPLLDKGPRLCKDMDGSACDIGLWGGK